jgi:DNA invertase Pin-like site-specific DNA recombinase
VGGHDNPARTLDADRLRPADRVEKELIRARTTEGRERAKARGVKLGRKPKMTEHQKREAIRHRDRDGEIVREITRSYNVSHSTISRLTV